MSSNLELRKKYTFKAHGKKIVLIKKSIESDEHVFCKAAAFALYLPKYPLLHVEMKIGAKYKPDLVSLDTAGEPVFWAECGQVSREKIKKLLKKYRNTHFVFLKWERDIEQFTELVGKEAAGIKRTSPVEVVKIPLDMENYIRSDGEITITFKDCEVRKAAQV